MKKANPFLLFDIETGGLDPSNNPILSISYKRLGNKTKTLYNAPPKGSHIAEWASENVWKPIQKFLGHTPQKTEEQSLTQFLGVLKAHRGGTLAGWNIGYVPVPMSKHTRGFDISAVMTRAHKYGLGDQFQEAFSGMNIRDIGREYSVRIAEQMTKHPDLIDEKLFKSAESFTKLVNINKGTQRLFSTPEIARWMGTPGRYGGYEVAGWKQKSVYKYLFGKEPTNQHLSHFDIESLSRIITEGDPSKLAGPEFAGILNLEALTEKAKASTRSRVSGLEGKLAGRAGALHGAIQEASGFIGRHKVGFGVAGAIGLGVLGYNLFSAKDDNYNTIEGLPHGGTAERMRRQFTDFGSGYQGDKKKSNGTKFAALAAGGALGGIGGFAFARRMWGGGKDLSFNRELYPRLAELRDIGSKHGYSIVSEALWENQQPEYGLSKLYNRVFGKAKKTWKGLAEKGHQGIVYNFSTFPNNPNFSAGGTPPKNIINFGHWNLGTDKWHTYDYYAKRGKGWMHPETYELTALFADGEYGKVHGQAFSGDFEHVKYNPVMGRQMFETETARTLMKDWGGPQNMIIKDAGAALQQGVWFGPDNLPDSIVEKMLLAPENYLVQRKIPLAHEFRAVTVGGKSIFAAHRFGNKTSDEFLKTLGSFRPDWKDYIKGKHYHENIMPIMDETMAERVGRFAEAAAAELPKGIDISAWDIGMTAEGKFSVIEMQRGFGTLKNPFVARRIEEMITGKSSRFTKEVAGLGLGLGIMASLGAYNLFSGSDDDHNTIKGLAHGGMAEKKRHELTKFGSGFIEGLKAFGGRMKRSFHVANLLNKESNRAIANITREIAHGAKAGKFLELGVVGATAAELGHFGLEVAAHGMTGGAVATAGASFVGMKYLYEAIKKRKTIASAAKFALANPLETKMGARMLGQTLSEQVGGYVKRGEQNYFSTYMKAGGGEYGKQSLLARFESELGTKLPELENMGVADLVALKSKFSGHDDAWNVIEGLKHGGLAEQMRKILSDFGSGWDALRGLARSGETFAEMTASSEFKLALQGAKEIGYLSEGAYGKTFKMASTFRGKEFNFVRKVGTISEREAAVMRELGEMGYQHSPTLYAFNKGAGATSTMDMELFQGRTFGNLTAQEAITHETAAATALGKMHAMGLEHGDVNAGNLMLVDTPTGAQVGVIDYGFANRPAGSIDPFAAQSPVGAIDIQRLKTTVNKQKAADLTSRTRSNTITSVDKQNWSDSHREAVIMAASNGKYGGRGHLSFKGRSK